MISDIRQKIRKNSARLELLSKKQSGAELSGDYRTLFAGQGYDFKELREYVPGDPVKYIDWNKYSSSGQVYLKTFEDERKRQVYCFVDVGAPMKYGFSWSKLESAAEYCAYISSSAQLNGDHCGLVLFDSLMKKCIKAAPDPKNPRLFVDNILNCANSADIPDWEGILRRFNSLVPSGNPIVFIISDFRGFPQGLRPLKLLQKRGDVMAVKLSHLRDIPAEINKKIDLFTTGAGYLDLGAAILEDKRQSAVLEREFSIKRPSLLCSDTSLEPMDELRRFFLKRRNFFGR